MVAYKLLREKHFAQGGPGTNPHPVKFNAALLRATENPKVKFMHCLPAFHDPNAVVGREVMEHTGMTSGFEVTGEVIDSPAAILFDQAENRLHTIKSVRVATLGP